MTECPRCGGSGRTSLMAGPGSDLCRQCNGAGWVRYTAREVEEVARALALACGRGAYEHRRYESAAIAAIEALDAARGRKCCS